MTAESDDEAQVVLDDFYNCLTTVRVGKHYKEVEKRDAKRALAVLRREFGDGSENLYPAPGTTHVRAGR